jgi:hypothetical protein
MKYQRQANFIKKKVYLVHHAGDSRTWHQYWVSSEKDLMVDGSGGNLYGTSDHIAK